MWRASLHFYLVVRSPQAFNKTPTYASRLLKFLNFLRLRRGKFFYVYNKVK